VPEVRETRRAPTCIPQSHVYTACGQLRGVRLGWQSYPLVRKVLIGGDEAVGKTAIVQQTCKQTFPENHVRFLLKDHFK
jgi:hypothetical protein